MNNSTFELGKLPSRNATLGLMKNRFSSLFSVIMAVLGFLLWLGTGQPTEVPIIVWVLGLTIPLLFNNLKHLSFLSTIRKAALLTLMMAAGLTFTTNAQSPGCTTIGPAVWIKADAGTNTTTEDAQVTSITNYGSTGGNVTGGTGTGVNSVAGQTTSPTFKKNIFNFNPGLFANSTTGMGMINALAANPASLTVYYVNKLGDITTWKSHVGFSSATVLGTPVSIANETVLMSNNAAPYIWQGSDGGATNPLSYNTSKSFITGWTWAGAGLGVANSINGRAGNTGSALAAKNLRTFLLATDPDGGAENGGRGSGTYYAEAIAFDQTLTAAEHQRVRTYLAIKYGITLDQTVATNYASSNATIWDVGANATYSKNILGIGSDLCQGLLQKQSKSINDDAYITLSNGTAVAATNAANTSTFSTDKSFDVIGDNGLSTGYATNYTASSFVPSVPSALFGMSRIWKVQETGTVGTVTISVPAGAERLLVFPAGTTNFSSGAVQEIAMVADGNGNVTAQVDFTNGQLFTFAKVVTAPGCVANGLQYWFDASVSVTGGTANVTSWKDKYADFTISKNNTGTITSSLGDAKSNFNPYVLFPSDAHLTGVIDPVALGRLHTTFAVAQKDANINATYNHAFRFGAGPGSGVFHDFGIGTVENAGNHYPTHHWYTKGTTINRYNTAYPVEFGTVGLYGARINSATATNNKDVSFNGNNLTFSDVITGNLSENMQIGGSLYGMQGRIPEVAYYNTALSDNDRNKVDSYFGIKYGLTLGHDYLSGAGATIYDVATYGNDVFGIGRDDCQALVQKQSRSVNSSAFVTISNAATVAATNAANTSTFSADKTFEMIGDNGLAANYGVNYAPSTFTPSIPSGFYGMNRVWRVRETGTVGTVTISVPAGPERLLVFAAGTTNFASGALQEIAMVSDGNGNVTAQYDFSNGQLFTFGATLTAPGCVTAGLQVWLRADKGTSTTTDGTALTKWNDQSGNGRDHTQATSTLQPKYKLNSGFNFNPAVTFDGSDIMRTAAFASGKEAIHVFTMSKAKQDNGWYSLYGFGSNLTHVQWYLNVPSAYLTGNKQYNSALQGATQGITSFLFPKTAADQQTIRWNGVSSNTNDANGMKTYAYNATTFGVGSDDNLTSTSQEMDGDIQEVIIYKTGTPTTDGGPMAANDVLKIESYLGLKYGLTLPNNYLSGGNVTIWNTTANSAYHNNVFGIGRDDCQSLNQKQSMSNTSTVMTLGIDNKILATNAANTGAFDTNTSFLVWGDNGIATGTTTSVTASPCNPESIDKYTARIWKSVETGSVESTKVSVDLSSYAFNVNFPVFMQVGTTDAFTSFENVLMVKNGTNYETNYDFTGIQFVRFTGNTTPPANVCSGDKEYRWNSPSFWSWGTKTRTSVLGDTQFKVTISDPTNGIYAPSVYPVGQYWWEHLFIPRYDAAGTNVITTRIEMNKVAYKTAFEIFDIDAYYGKDVVKVYGKLAGAIVNPVLTLPVHTALTTSGNVVTATTGAWDINIRGRVYVNFNSPIDEIYVEYSKSGGYNFKTYQDLRISNIDVTCKPIIPEVVTPDNVYIAKQVTKSAPKVGEPFKYKFTLKNLSCNAKTINFTDILPAGSNLKWVDSTLVTGMTYTSASSYGGTQALSITGLSVPVGDSYLYINAIGTTAGTYDNQATFTVGANTYQSDEPNIAGGANPTPVTLTADRPLSNLTITKAVDKTSAGANEVIKYTYTITNPNATSVLTSFTDNLPNTVDGAFKYVAGSLTGASGATINPSSYGGESSLTITNLTIPTSGLTLSVSVNTGSFTSGQVGRNVASITPDPSTIYDTKPIGSNTVNTTIAGCSAGSDAPAFAKTTVTNLCPSTTINLTAMVATNLPANTVVTWHNTVNASGTNLVPNPGAAPAGTYFAAFYDATNLCYSGAGSATTQVTGTVVGCPSNITVSNACPATTVDLTSRVVGPYPSGKTLTWHSGAPTNTNKISNASTAGNGTYYAAYYDAVNDCYSPATSNGITVNIITCATCTAGSTAPSIASTSLTNVCPQTTVDLSSITASNSPSGSVLTWYKTATPSNAEELSGTSAIGAGTYYAAFHDLTANCFSPSTPVTVTATACQNDLYVDLTTAISQPSPSLSVASASNITVTVSNSGTGPTLIGHPTNTSVTLPAGVSAPATFTSNGWSCVTTGQTVNCSTTSIIAATNGSSAFVVPITPDASTLGTTPTITAGTAPYIIELTTTNNTATMTPTTAVVAPDLTTTIGQPATPLVAGAASNIPVTVANIGTGPTTGSPITTTIALPSGVTAPASFTNGGWGCTTVGSTVSCTTAGPIANGANSSFNVPITPSVAGTTPVITGGTEPTTGEVVTNNNGATMTPTVAVAGVPDLTTSIGQPTTTLTAGVVSNIPVTVANIGGGATTGSPITTTMTLPAGVTAPASFSSNGWSCTTVGSAINCTTAGPIASAGSTTFNVPVTPNASTVGTSPVFSAGTTPTTNEIVTTNNTSTMTPTSAVVAGVTPDLTMTIGQPATALRIGASSDIPVTITNIGSAATDGGAISVSMTLPANVSPTTATFTNNGWSCTTAGQVITCTKTTTITSSGGTATFNIPVTPAAATAGTTPTFTGGVTPTTGETATANNTATMVPSATILGRPDLTTSIGQPSPALQQGSVSNLPVTVANIGNAPSTGTSITTTVGLPAGVTAPASFSNNGWNCTTASSVVTCATPTPIAGGANSIFNIPITPGVSTVGTTPTFTGGTSPDPAETVTGNNQATPLVSSPAVTGLPDLTTSIGQPSPALSAGVPSNVPVTVTNIGTGPANGPIVTSLTLPTGTSAPASFTDGPWTCATTGQTVACTTAGPIASNNGSSTVNVPVTPTAAIIGTTPPFNATTTPLAGEPNTTNNNATPMTPNIAVAGCVTATVGGTVGFAGTLPVCNAANSGTLTLTGHTGTVVKWQTSSNNWVSSTDIANTATTYTFMNAANNQQYRAVVQNSTQCAVVNSAAATITTSAGACSATCDYAAPVIVK